MARYAYVFKSKLLDYNDEYLNQKKAEMTIPVMLLDPPTYALMEYKYRGFIRFMSIHCHYMLKSQFRELYGKSRTAGQNALQELIKHGILSEGSFRGCHYVYPTNKAMKFTFGESFIPVRPHVSDVILLSHFLRVELFLQDHHGQSYPIAFPTDQPTSFLPVENKDHGFYTHLQKLRTRNCFYLGYTTKEDNKKIDCLFYAMTHFHSSAQTRYEKALEALEAHAKNTSTTFQLLVLCESDVHRKMAEYVLHKATKKLTKKNTVPIGNGQFGEIPPKIQRCIGFEVINTNLERYFIRGDNDKHIRESDFEELNDIIDVFYG